MKVAVTDACIFIDLLDSDAHAAFFMLPIEVVTTKQVWGELEIDQKQMLQSWLDSGELTIIKVDQDLKAMRSKYDLSNKLSVADLSVWAICNEGDGILLTSDGTLRKMANDNKIETHGLLWIFDQIVKTGILSVEEATNKIKIVFNQNIYYKSDSKLFEAYEKLITEWHSL